MQQIFTLDILTHWYIIKDVDMIVAHSQEIISHKWGNPVLSGIHLGGRTTQYGHRPTPSRMGLTPFYQTKKRPSEVLATAEESQFCRTYVEKYYHVKNRIVNFTHRNARPDRVNRAGRAHR